MILTPTGDSVLLKIEAQSTKVKAGSPASGEKTPSVAYKAIGTTDCVESVPMGGTLVVRGGRRRSDQVARDIFLIIVPTAVEK